MRSRSTIAARSTSRIVAPCSAPTTSAAGAVGAVQWARPGEYVSSKSSTWPVVASQSTRSPELTAARAAGSSIPPAAHASQSANAARYRSASST